MLSSLGDETERKLQMSAVKQRGREKKGPPGIAPKILLSKRVRMVLCSFHRSHREIWTRNRPLSEPKFLKDFWGPLPLPAHIPLARNQYINNSPGIFSCIRAGANTGAACIPTEMNSLPNMGNIRKIAPQKYFPVFARVRIQALRVFAKINSPRIFSCMYWFCAGGVVLQHNPKNPAILKRLRSY